MATLEYKPIGPRIDEITGDDRSRDHYGPVSGLTSRFQICVDQTRDPLRRTIRILPKGKTERDPRFPDTGIFFSVTYDDDGNYLGINDTLTIWRETDDNAEWFVEYTPDDEDPTIGRVSSVSMRTGPENERRAHPVKEFGWEEALGLASLPIEINIPDSVHRLVFGQDLGINRDLTDLEIQQRPLLVPYIP